MQMQYLELRNHCTSEQSGFGVVEKLSEGGKVSLVESSSGNLPELVADDVVSVLNSVEDCSMSLTPDTTRGSFVPYKTGDDVVSAENYDCWLSDAAVSETNIGDAFFQNSMDASQLYSNLAPDAMSYHSGGIDSLFMDLYSPSPHVGSTSANVQSSVAAQDPLSPSLAAGTSLQQLNIGAASLAVSGRTGSPQVILHAPMQVQHQTFLCTCAIFYLLGSFFLNYVTKPHAVLLKFYLQVF